MNDGGQVSITEREWPPLEPPEWRIKKNLSVCKRKSIFVADDDKIPLDSVLEIAKDQAQKMGMGNKELLVASDASYSVKEKGWQVIVKSRI